MMPTVDKSSRPTTDRLHACGMDEAAPTDPTAKEFATLQAAMALRGWQLDRDRLGRFVVAQWGRTREFDTWDQVCAFAHQIGVPK